MRQRPQLPGMAAGGGAGLPASALRGVVDLGALAAKPQAAPAAPAQAAPSGGGAEGSGPAGDGPGSWPRPWSTTPPTAPSTPTSSSAR